MPEYLHPGVYIEEIERGPRPIEGVPTSTAARPHHHDSGPHPERPPDLRDRDRPGAASRVRGIPHFPVHR